MKKYSISVGAVFTVILMVLTGLTSTVTAEEVVSPKVSYFFQPKEVTILMSGSRQGQSPNFIAKVKFVSGGIPIVEKLPVPDIQPAREIMDAGAMSIRDLSVTNEGHINLLVGTFKPRIMSFNGNTWKTIIEGVDRWGLVNNGSAGGFAVDTDGNFFLPGMWIVNSRTGVYKTSPAGKQFKLFAEGLEPMDLCYQGGTIYAVEDSQSSIKVILLDATTGESKGWISLPAGDHRAISVAKDGSMYVADWSGLISHIGTAGETINQMVLKTIASKDETSAPLHITDIDISPDGQYLAVGTADGYVGILSADLKNPQLLSLDTYGFVTFVAWPP